MTFWTMMMIFYFTLFHLSLMMIMIFLHFLNLYNNDNGHLVDAEAPRSRPRVSCPPPPAAALSPTFETFTFYNLSSTTMISTFYILHCRTL